MKHFTKSTFAKSIVVTLAGLSLMACNEKDLVSSIDGQNVDLVDFEKTSMETTIDSISNAAFDASPQVDDIDLQIVTDLGDTLPAPDEDVDAAPEDEEDRPFPNIPLCPEPAFKQECRSNGTHSKQMQKYGRCLIKGTRTVLSGTVRLTYNNPNCSLASNGSAVRRVHSLFYNHLPSGKTRHVTSARQPNYKRQVIGGGEKLKNTPFGYALSIRGVNADVRNEFGRKIVNASAHTNRSIKFFDQRSEGAVFVHGGVLVVDHNKAKFTAKYAPRKLKWQSDCSCPVSGELLFKYEGTRTAAGVVEFKECGIALIKKRNGSERLIEREACLKDNDGGPVVTPAEPVDPEPVDESDLDAEPEDDQDDF